MNRKLCVPCFSNHSEHDLPLTTYGLLFPQDEVRPAGFPVDADVGESGVHGFLAGFGRLGVKYQHATNPLPPRSK